MLYRHYLRPYCSIYVRRTGKHQEALQCYDVIFYRIDFCQHLGWGMDMSNTSCLGLLCVWLWWPGFCPSSKEPWLKNGYGNTSCFGLLCVWLWWPGFCPSSKLCCCSINSYTGNYYHLRLFKWLNIEWNTIKIYYFIRHSIWSYIVVWGSIWSYMVAWFKTWRTHVSLP